MVDYDHTSSPPNSPLKHCSKCGETKPCAAFSRSKGKRDGLQAHCKQCEAMYRSDNADKISGRMARYYRENAAKLRERSARYRSENPAKVSKRHARWYRANPDDALVKRCPCCGETKPCAAFSRSKRDGLQPHCKQCNAQYHRKNADKIHERHARYYSENPAKMREYQARYNRENPTKVRERNARWQQANPDKLRASSHRRRATKRALPAQWSDSDAQRMLAYWGNRCAICNQHVEPNNAFYILAADHWIAITDPRPDNPGTVPWNMLPLCHSKIGNALGCNSAKSDADPIEWLHSLYPDDPKLVTKILARIAKYFKFIVTDGAL